MKYSAVLFDFDYTLADSSKGIVTCFSIVLKRHNYNDITEEAIKRTIGKTLEDSFSILTGITDSDRLFSLRNEYSKEASTYMTCNTFLFPYTKAVLEELKKRGMILGIISTKFRYRISEFTDLHFAPGFFDIIVGAEDVSQHKPNAEGILFAMEKLGLSPEDTLYIGDSIIDAETAVNGDVDFIGVTSGMTTKEELSEYPNIKIVSSLKEIL